MVPEKGEVDLTPLEQIRQCEADMTRRILAAHEAADKTVAKAALEAAAIKQQAREDGSREGQTRLREAVSKAEEEAKLLVVQSKQRAELLRQKGNQRIDAAVRQAVQIVLGLDEEK